MLNLRSMLAALLALRSTARLAKRVVPTGTRRRRNTRSRQSIWPHGMILLGILGLAGYFGFRGMHWGELPQLNPPANHGKATAASTPTVPQPSYSPVAAEQPASHRTLIIGSFNIQVFGRAKLGNPSVMGILVDIARRFDLLAIQELRSTEQDIIPRFVQMINQDGSNFRYIVGPRQGHTISKEQYVYLYDANKLAPIAPPYVAFDATGQFHRAPLVCHFRSLEAPAEQAFSFILLNVHTDPDEIKFEIPELRRILDRVRQENPHEDDFIVLGDLNAPPRYFLSFQWFDVPHAAIDDDWVTNVRENRNYDNLVFDRQATREFTGRRGVFNFRRAYQLELEEALQVSDHFPVWAEFTVTEVRATMSELQRPPAEMVPATR